MSLLTTLGLPALSSPPRPAASAPAAAPPLATDDEPEPSRASARTSAAASSRKGAKRGGKVTTIDFEDGDTIVAGEPTVRQLPIGRIVWASGQGRRQIWGLINTAGELAEGGDAWHEKALAEMNSVAVRGVELVVGLQQREEKFRVDLFRVKKGAKDGARLLAEVKTLGPAIARRMKKDDDFYEDVRGFTNALADAKKSAKNVSRAAKEFDAATSALQAAVFDEKTYHAKKEVEAAEAAVGDKQRQIDDAKAIFKTAVDIATKVAKQEWGAIASKVLDYVQEKAIDAAADALVAGRLIEQLEALKAQLEKARDKVDEFEIGALDARLMEKQAKLEAAVKDLEMAHDDLHEALMDLPGAQRNAINELAEDKSTAPAARAIQARATQIGDIETARASCREYVGVADKAKARVQQFVNLFQDVGTFLKKAAAEQPYYADDKPYGRELYRASLKNAIAFGDWAMSVASVKREAADALVWLAKTDDDGPLAPFDKAIEATRKDLGRA